MTSFPPNHVTAAIITPLKGLRATILNVDDSESARYARTRELMNAGYRVIEAGTGQEALLMIDTLEPHVIVLDVNLPDISGLAVCRAIKGDPATAHMMGLQVSAVRTTAMDRASGLNSGADAYLIEPIDPLELVSTVNALLRLAAREADHAARKTAEAALRERESFYRQTVESIPGMVFTNRTRWVLRLCQRTVGPVHGHPGRGTTRIGMGAGAPP
jgi:DNA-binding response OmpR family regulator